MGDSDEVEGPETGLIVLSCWVPSGPEEMKRAFTVLLDTIETEAVGVLDWGTMVFDTIRAIHPDTGQELHLFTIGVKEIK